MVMSRVRTAMEDHKDVRGLCITSSNPMESWPQLFSNGNTRLSRSCTSTGQYSSSGSSDRDRGQSFPDGENMGTVVRHEVVWV